MMGASGGVSRRAVLGGLAGAAMLSRAAWAQDGAAPFRATLLEHVGIVVPDVTAAARFHSRLFNPAIRTEMQPDPLRLYVDLNGGYLAFGSRPGVTRAFIDHFCALIADYDSGAAAAALDARGVARAAGWDVFGLFHDDDGIGVQLVADPGGWFDTVIDAAPLVSGPPLVTPRGMTHVTLAVSDLGASGDFYRTWFGPETEERDGRLRFAMGATDLFIHQATNGEGAGITRMGVRTAPFDMDGVCAALLDMGARAATPGRAGLELIDPDGLTLDLTPEAA